MNAANSNDCSVSVCSVKTGFDIWFGCHVHARTRQSLTATRGENRTGQPVLLVLANTNLLNIELFEAN